MQSDNQRQLTGAENEYVRDVASLQERIRAFGPSSTVDRFLSGYGKIGTKRVYAANLLKYLRWLQSSKGLTLSPDALIQDNLVCVFKSDPTDTLTKRRHTDWLNQFINVDLIEKGSTEDARTTSASAVKRFYESNDSALFGDFRVSTQDAIPPAPALEAGDIRAVLKALPLNQRLPLLFTWQSSAEINRVLSLTWEVFTGSYPLKLQFYGRKNHKKPYHTYLGRDSISGLKVWRERWTELQGREPGPKDLIFMGKGGPMDTRYLN